MYCHKMRNLYTEDSRISNSYTSPDVLIHLPTNKSEKKNEHKSLSGNFK